MPAWLMKAIRVVVGVPVAAVYALTGVLYKLMFFLPAKAGLPYGSEGMKAGDKSFATARSWVNP